MHSIVQVVRPPFDDSMSYIIHNQECMCPEKKDLDHKVGIDDLSNATLVVCTYVPGTHLPRNLLLAGLHTVQSTYWYFVYKYVPFADFLRCRVVRYV